MQDKKIIVLFDGVCNLCNGFVNFIIKVDRKNKIKFAPLQSNYAKNFILKEPINIDEPDSVIVIINDTVYTKSSAAIKVLYEIGGFWKAFYVLLIIPKFIRDFFYSIISRNRYRIFGKRTSCMVPNSKYKERYLD